MTIQPGQVTSPAQEHRDLHRAFLDLQMGDKLIGRAKEVEAQAEVLLERMDELWPKLTSEERKAEMAFRSLWKKVYWRGDVPSR